MSLASAYSLSKVNRLRNSWYPGAFRAIKRSEDSITVRSSFVSAPLRIRSLRRDAVISPAIPEWASQAR